MLNNTEIMGNEQECQPILFLQILQEVDNLSLNRDVQCRNRLITDNDLGIHSQSPGNSDPLPLSAAELVWIAAGMITS